MKLIRSLLFNIYYVVTTLFFCLTGLLTGLMPRQARSFHARLWGKALLFGLRWIVGIKCEVRGRENLPADGGYIVASKHQSALETIALMHLQQNELTTSSPRYLK